jgi:putative iron-dependent peroxidase
MLSWGEEIHARSPRVLEQMLENMFVGLPPGNYDRLLDFTHPVTGTLLFAPPASFLDAQSGLPSDPHATVA